MKKFGFFVVLAGFVFSVCGVQGNDNFGTQSAALSTAPNNTGKRCNKCRNVVDFCDGVDNDCDGITDEDDPNIGSKCVKILDRVPRQGSLECTHGYEGARLTCQIDCQPYEACDDGIDNDCDGVVDENCVSKLGASLAADSPSGVFMPGAHTPVLYFNLFSIQGPAVVERIVVQIYATCGQSLLPLSIIKDRLTGKVITYPLSIDTDVTRRLGVYADTTSCRPGDALKASVIFIGVPSGTIVTGLPVVGYVLTF